MFELFAQQVRIVTSAGNEAIRSRVADTLPEIWTEIMPLIVVGAVTLRSEVAKFSQISYNWSDTVWAPGVGIRCAGGDSPSGMKTVDGASPAAGMVSFYHLVTEEAVLTLRYR